MEYNSAGTLQDEKVSGSMNESSETYSPQSISNAVRKKDSGTAEDVVSRKDFQEKEAHGHPHTAGEVNMEAAITQDDVLRAGGLGARDDLSSFLPVASDATDIEQNLLDARDYEEAQGRGETRRPGLGWTGDADMIE